MLIDTIKSDEKALADMSYQEVREAWLLLSMNEWPLAIPHEDNRRRKRLMAVINSIVLRQLTRI